MASERGVLRLYTLSGVLIKMQMLNGVVVCIAGKDHFFGIITQCGLKRDCIIIDTLSMRTISSCQVPVHEEAAISWAGISTMVFSILSLLISYNFHVIPFNREGLLLLIAMEQSSFSQWKRISGCQA